MININYKGMLWGFAIALLLCMFLGMMVLNAGCVTAAKKVYRDATATPVPTPTPIPTTPPTPKPTPTPIPTVPTLAAHFVDPFRDGERWEGQWFKWHRLDVQGYKDLQVGIMVYRHKFMDSYTWYNHALGQYMEQDAPAGSRWFVVWVHEEMMGDNSSYDPSMWIFDESSFRLQVRGKLIEADTTHNPVNNIQEFENYYDYYNTVIAGPFSYIIKYTGFAPETGGYSAMRQGWLRWGKGNAVDGYIIFEIPKDTREEEVVLLGSFSTFGNAYWKFST